MACDGFMKIEMALYLDNKSVLYLRWQEPMQLEYCMGRTARRHQMRPRRGIGGRRFAGSSRGRAQTLRFAIPIVSALDPGEPGQFHTYTEERLRGSPQPRYPCRRLAEIRRPARFSPL